jgi:hypothetical protein
VEESLERARYLSMTGRLYRYSRNVLAAVGLFSILASGAYLVVDSFLSGWGEKTVLKTATSPDSSAKATLYQIDVGATGATRTYVALSNPQVDGTKKGNIVLTLTNLQKDAGQVGLAWEANRLLVITYPGGGRVEYAVSTIRGITIELVAN